MATVNFPSLADADVIEVEFLKANGTCESLRLLVDSGFSGTSSVVLPSTATDLFWAKLPAKQIVGAIHGLQDRAWVPNSGPELSANSDRNPCRYIVVVAALLRVWTGRADVPPAIRKLGSRAHGERMAVRVE